MLIRKTHLAALILPVLLACSAARAEVSALEQLLIDKQYPAFVSAAEQAVEQGDAEALFLLGKTYHLGLGVDVDLGKAKNFYRQAADKDSARAWHNLGTIELARNRAEEAIQYLEKALKLGLKTPTESNLGRAYLIEGERIHSTVLLTKAMHYLRQDYAIQPTDATLANLISASVSAYRFCKNNPATREKSPALYVEAMKWLELGISRDFDAAIAHRGAILIDEGKVAEAIPWLEKAAERKKTGAAYNLGLAFSHDNAGINKDLDRALHWFEIASKQGVYEAHYHIIDILVDRLRDPFRASTPELTTAITMLQTEIAPSLSYDEKAWIVLQKAERHLLQRHVFEQNEQTPKPLPEGQVQFNPCLTAYHITLPNTRWRIVALSKPTENPLDLNGLIEGTTDQKSCIDITAAQSNKLKQAINDGKLLIWIFLFNESNETVPLILQNPIQADSLKLEFPKIKN